MANPGFQLTALDAAERYDETTPVFMQPLIEQMLEAAAPKDTDSVLDLACGTGTVARQAPARVTGVDLNPGMLAVARRRDDTIPWVQASAQALPFATDSFDVAVSNQGVQFFPDAPAAVAEVRRVVRAGGRIAATAWAPLEQSPYLHARSDALQQTMPPDVIASFAPIVPVDGEGLLRQAFETAGLTNVEVRLITASVDLPPLGQYVAGHMRGTPWGPAFDALDEAGQQRVIDIVTERIGDGRGVLFSSYLATARA